MRGIPAHDTEASDDRHADLVRLRWRNNLDGIVQNDVLEVIEASEHALHNPVRGERQVETLPYGITEVGNGLSADQPWAPQTLS